MISNLYTLKSCINCIAAINTLIYILVVALATGHKSTAVAPPYYLINEGRVKLILLFQTVFEKKNASKFKPLTILLNDLTNKYNVGITVN